MMVVAMVHDRRRLIGVAGRRRRLDARVDAVVLRRLLLIVLMLQMVRLQVVRRITAAGRCWCGARRQMRDLVHLHGALVLVLLTIAVPLDLLATTAAIGRR